MINVFLLLVMVSVFFSMIGYNFLANNFFLFKTVPYGENICLNPLQCLVTALSYGVRNPGGLADFSSYESFLPENRLLFYVRIFYDFSFFVILDLVV